MSGCVAIFTANFYKGVAADEGDTTQATARFGLLYVSRHSGCGRLCSPLGKHQAFDATALGAIVECRKSRIICKGTASDRIFQLNFQVRTDKLKLRHTTVAVVRQWQVSDNGTRTSGNMDRPAAALFEPNIYLPIYDISCQSTKL